MVDCKEINLSNQAMDPSGVYVKIKVDFVTRRIGVMICDQEHHEIEVFWGRQSQDLCFWILKDERARSWFKDTTHIAYLGRETKKAEIALATGGSYYQE